MVWQARSLLPWSEISQPGAAHACALCCRRGSPCKLQPWTRPDRLGRSACSSCWRASAIQSAQLGLLATVQVQARGMEVGAGLAGAVETAAAAAAVVAGQGAHKLSALLAVIDQSEMKEGGFGSGREDGSLTWPAFWSASMLGVLHYSSPAPLPLLPASLSTPVP